uniref:GMP reductase n=1 Tax=Meloidogyne incognita TaxID=6306 RepID=A0A914N7P7_MELIC
MPRIIDGVKFDFSDVLLVPKRSTLKSRSEVDLNREFIFKHSKQHYNGTPVVASNMDTVGTFEMARALAQVNCFTTIHKWYTIDDWKNFRDQAKENPKIFDNIAVSSGSSNDDFDKIRQVLEAVPELKYICLDVANGYSETFVDIIRRVREQFANHTIFAGNVVTAEMVEQLILTGADLVKVGIGPGSVCTTRSKAGVGYPQFSAVLECSDAAHGLGGHIISDGGCTCPGDVAKAFGAGADFVMLGGLLAGHDQSGGEIIEKNGKKFKLFYGMASSTAMKKHHGTVVADYRASEGKTISIPYRGDVMTTIKDILGGLRSACTYVGAPKIKELSKRATFVQVRQTTNEVFTRFEV